MSRLSEETGQQPEVAARLLEQVRPRLGDLGALLRSRGSRQVLLVARGSSDNAARYAQYLWQAVAGVPVALATPSLTTVYGRTPDLADHAVVAISQSGRSPDVVAVVEEARAAGRPTLAVTNDPGSPLALAAEQVLDLGAGPERSVAATKTYTASLLAVALLSVALEEGGRPGRRPRPGARRPAGGGRRHDRARGGRGAAGRPRPRGLRRPRAAPVHRARDRAQADRADRQPGGAVLPGGPDARPGRRGRSRCADRAGRAARAGHRLGAGDRARPAPPPGPGGAGGGRRRAGRAACGSGCRRRPRCRAG